jgi:hypothetical protein
MINIELEKKINCPKCDAELDPKWIDLRWQTDFEYIGMEVWKPDVFKDLTKWDESMLNFSKKKRQAEHRFNCHSANGYYCESCEFVMFDRNSE